ncbi:MAG: glucose 1-dehydrogenase [Gammaproteobacteria bacterium]|nr:glucose 1-dehydrogenase [Gammaproteobacteria bacterium]
MLLRDKIAIVTGAGSGFGEGMARRFVQEGAQVVVADLDAGAAERVAGEIGAAARPVHMDVSVAADFERAVRTAAEDLGGLDILVNNAGYTHRNSSLLDVTEDVFDRIMAVNVKSIYLGARYAIPAFRDRGGGVILNIASTAGVRPRPGLTWYNGSKGAVITLTKSMAVELAAEKIRVCALNPVAGETGMLPLFLGEDSEERRNLFRATIPLGRLSTPQDIARAATFLVSDEAEFLTGVCLEVDGGRCI